jgi:DNA-binding MarR family transcriptional regulator
MKKTAATDSCTMCRMSEASKKKTAPAARGGYRLSTSFPYLARRVGLRIGELFELAAGSLGVDVPTYRVLAALREQGGQTLSDLSKATDIPLPTLSRLVTAMSRQGLVTRARPESNGRIVAISLLPQGQQLVEALVPMAIRLEQFALNGLSAAETRMLKDQLEKAFSNLDAAEAEIRDGGQLSQIAQQALSERQTRKRA